jgi:DNA polymerase-3 subunit delta
VEKIINAANTHPFFSDIRLVYARNTRLFAAGRKDDSETMAAYLPQIPETTVLVFVETDIDKRGRLYKQMAECGRAVEFKTPSESELVTWVCNVFKKDNHTISNENARLLLHTVTHSMEAVHAEAEKLCSYAGERQEIKAEDIRALSSPSLETRVFDLLDAVGYGKTEEALIMYRHMILMKEQPLMVLTMMARHFRLMAQCRAYLDKKTPNAEIAKLTDIRGFLLDGYLRQARRFTQRQLLEALADCADTDIRIKTGLINAETGVELILLKSSAPDSMLA